MWRKMAATDPYKLLGIAEDASTEKISSAYRRLARQYHPDATGGDAKKTEHFREVAAAYHDLRDRSRRSEVDDRLRDERARAKAGRRPAAPQPAAGSAPPQWSRSPTPARRTDFGLRAGRASTKRARPSPTPFTDLASTVARVRPRSEGLGWFAAGAAADLLFAIGSTRGK